MVLKDVQIYILSKYSAPCSGTKRVIRKRVLGVAAGTNPASTTINLLLSLFRERVERLQFFLPALNTPLTYRDVPSHLHQSSLLYSVKDGNALSNKAA